MKMMSAFVLLMNSSISEHGNKMHIVSTNKSMYFVSFKTDKHCDMMTSSLVPTAHLT